MAWAKARSENLNGTECAAAAVEARRALLDIHVFFKQLLDGSFDSENKTEHQSGFWACAEPLQVDCCEWSTRPSCGAQAFDFSWAHEPMMPTNLSI